MKSKLFRALDAPLYITLAMLLVGIIEGDNILFHPPSYVYPICMVVAWLIRYASLYISDNMKEQEEANKKTESN